MTKYKSIYKNKAKRGYKFIKPQFKGRINVVTTLTPRKPNSARRKSLKLSTAHRNVISKLPGPGNTPPKYATVLIQGGGYRDVPLVNTTIIRGTCECPAGAQRKTKRSKYGIKKYICQLSP